MSRANPTKHVNMRIPVELLTWIDQRAQANQVTRTEQVIRMVEFSRQVVVADQQQS